MFVNSSQSKRKNSLNELSKKSERSRFLATKSLIRLLTLRRKSIPKLITMKVFNSNQNSYEIFMNDGMELSKAGDYCDQIAEVLSDNGLPSSMHEYQNKMGSKSSSRKPRSLN